MRPRSQPSAPQRLKHGGFFFVADRGTRQGNEPGRNRLAAFPDRVEAYKGGRKGLKGFFVGQIMKKSRGTANPQLVQQLLAEKLD